MKSRVAILVCLAGFSLAAGAMPHASLNQLAQQSDPDCIQAGGDNGLKDLIQQVNLFKRYNPATGTNDPRGELKTMSRSLKIQSHENRLLEAVGDIFCPEISSVSQGTAILIGKDGTLVTNAHVFLDDHGNDSPGLPKCFWQRKNSNEHFPIDAKSFAPLTRKPRVDFSVDLSVVRLQSSLAKVKKALANATPAELDKSNIPLREGDELIMVSASMDEVPRASYLTLPLVALSGRPVDVSYTKDLIVQKCAVEQIGSNNGIWGNCAGIDGASGSGVFIVRGNQIILKGIHVSGGKRLADNTDFTLEKGTPKGMSFSYAAQINEDVLDQLQSIQAQNDKGRSSLGEQRASLDPR